jgi:hypothetical protein
MAVQFDSSFRTAKDVVSRRNQDGTVILMKQNASGIFYKMDGIAAAAWMDLTAPKTPSALAARFAQIYPGEEERLRKDLAQLFEQLLSKQLIVQLDGVQPSDFQVSPILPQDYRFGALKEFDLEQIETEVLNESIYLDVFAGSDLRLKKDIEPISGALEKVSALNGVRYRWNPETAATGDRAVHAGFLAQDVAAVMPELVRKDERTQMLAIDYAKMNSYLVEAIKELGARIESLEKKLREN